MRGLARVTGCRPLHLGRSRHESLRTIYYYTTTAIYSLPTTHDLPPTTYYLLPITYNLLTTYYPRPTTYYLLPTTYYLLPTIYLLPTTYYYWCFSSDAIIAGARAL